MPTPRCLPRRGPALGALVAVLSLVSCGGDETGDRGSQKATPARDVQALARQAFGPNRAATSGRIDGRIDITVAGARDFREPVALASSLTM